MFTAQGKIKGTEQAHTVTWNDGTLTGDETAILRIETRADVLDGVPVGPPEGPYTVRNHLRSGLSTVLIMLNVFDGDVRFSGDVPSRPPVPVGAIG